MQVSDGLTVTDHATIEKMFRVSLDGDSGAIEFRHERIRIDGGWCFREETMPELTFSRRMHAAVSGRCVSGLCRVRLGMLLALLLGLAACGGGDESRLP
ncbi:MAG TPA: hypothetical protein VFZ93_04270, partial [Albitalea sp.]